MKVAEVYLQGRNTWMRLYGGKHYEMPSNLNLDGYLHAYIDSAGLGAQPKATLFRTATTRTCQLTDRPMSQADAYLMIQRRSLAAGIGTEIGNHSFRATGITEYLQNGGKLEIA